MNLHIYINDKLGRRLEDYSKLSGMKRNKIVTEALEGWISAHQKLSWPNEIMDFKGISNLPEKFAFEATREELTNLRQDFL